MAMVANIDPTNMTCCARPVIATIAPPVRANTATASTNGKYCAQQTGIRHVLMEALLNLSTCIGGQPLTYRYWETPLLQPVYPIVYLTYLAKLPYPCFS